MLYRFEFKGKGIYEAADLHCPAEHPMRSVKPDGGWLFKAGPLFPGAVSYWTEAGLEKYISTGIQDWHRAVIPDGIEVVSADLVAPPSYEDEFQIIGPPQAFQPVFRHGINEFFLHRSKGTFREKVGAFVTRFQNGHHELLVFRHLHHPEAGIQFPAGSVEKGESPLKAVLRELQEEAGLRLEAAEKFGEVVFFKNHNRQYQRRHLFHLPTPTQVPNQWIHEVKSGGSDQGLLFEFFWRDLKDLEKTLFGIEGLAQTLTLLRKKLSIK